MLVKNGRYVMIIEMEMINTILLPKVDKNIT